MKTKIKLFFISILFISAIGIFAQQSNQSAGPIPKMRMEGREHSIVKTFDNPASIAYAHNSQGGATFNANTG